MHRVGGGYRVGVFVFLCLDVSVCGAGCDNSECGVLGCLEFVEICVGDYG